MGTVINFRSYQSHKDAVCGDLDPDPLTDTVHKLVGEWDVLLHGKDPGLTINSVVCKFPTESGTKEQKIAECTQNCLTNASQYLGEEAASTAPQTCPIACTYAYDHPTQVTC